MYDWRVMFNRKNKSHIPISYYLSSTLIIIVLLSGCQFNTLKRSETFLSNGKNYEAVELLEEYIRKNTKDPEAYMLLGKAYKEVRRYDDAVQQFQKASLHYSKKPKLRITARLELARTYLIYGDRDSAFRVLKLILGTTSDSAVMQEVIELVGDSYDTKQLTYDGSDNYSPSFSPDGSKIAFASFKGDNSEIYIMDLKGRINRRVTYSSDFNDSSPTFLKTPNYIFYSSEPKSSREVKILIQSSGSTPIYTGFNITHIHNKKTTSILPISFGARVPNVSQVTNKVVYETNTDKNLELYILELDGIDLAQINPQDIKPKRITYTESDEGSPAFFPTGDQIVFVSSRNDVNQLYTISVNGKNEKHFNPNPYDCYNPTVSPDGKSIAFVSARDEDWEIYMIDSNGKNERKITNGIGRSIQPTFSPNGRHIAFVSDRTDNFQIFLMDLQRPVTRKDIVTLLR